MCKATHGHDHSSDNDTPVLNALKALHGAPISMGRGETPVGDCQPPSVSASLVKSKNLQINQRHTIILNVRCGAAVIRKEAVMDMDGSAMTKQVNSGKRTYTVEEIASILGIGRTAAYSLVHSGIFKSVRVGSAIRVSKASFDEWLDKQI